MAGNEIVGNLGLRLRSLSGKTVTPLSYHIRITMNASSLIRFLTLVGAFSLANWHASAIEISGSVQIAGAPVTRSTVTLYAAGTGAPKPIGQVKSVFDGSFSLEVADLPADGVFYILAKGGVAKAAETKAINENLLLMSLLGTSIPETITINELTTVASAFTAVRFLDGVALSGNPKALRIAASNVSHFVDVSTGGYGNVLMNPLNSSRTTTLANLNTLASLVSAFATVPNADWHAQILKAATPPGGVNPVNTLDALAGIARVPWSDPKAVYAAFDQAYPLPKDGTHRAAPFSPFLDAAPNDFALMLYFANGEFHAGGKLAFDSDGNLWAGQEGNSAAASGETILPAGMAKYSPDGKPLSPVPAGFPVPGVSGIGWGTAMSADKVWAAGRNGKIGLLDQSGSPASQETEMTISGQPASFAGVAVASNGDVWVADATGDQLVVFPGGQPKDVRLVKVEGLKSPFGIAIDAQNRIWVSNSRSNDVVRFSASDPSKVDTFRCGIGGRGVALDSKGNFWVASAMSPDFSPEKASNLARALAGDPKITTGGVNMIRSNGSSPLPFGFTGNQTINVPSGVSIDGNDDVWVANSFGRSIVLLAGEDTKGHPENTKVGDLVHQFQGASLQMISDVVVDPAGNVWAANGPNILNDTGSATPSNNSEDSGFTVIYGVAAPVKTPAAGQ